ncbi:MAG: hypothetical protein U0797_08175 [Gemmataceae bacterium]
MCSTKSPELAAFEEELRRHLAAEPGDPRATREWRRALDEWIAVHPYVQRRASCEALRRCRHDARTAEEVAAETTGRLWQDLSRVEEPALGWDGRDSGFWPTVIRLQTLKTLRENAPSRIERQVTVNSEWMQALLDNASHGEPADARLIREEDEERREQWRLAVDREIQRLISKLEGQPGKVAHRFVVLGLDFNTIAKELNITRGTVLDHWHRALSILGQQVDLHALAEEYGVELPPELADSKLIDRLYRGFR